MVHNQTDPVVESFPSHTHFLVLSCTSDNDIRDFTQDRKSYLTHASVGGGGTLIFSFIRRLVFFLFFFVFFSFFFFGGGGGQKNEKKKLGSDDFVDIFWVITK